MTAVRIGIGVLAVLCIGVLWTAYRYRKEKASAATFTIVETQKGMQKRKEDTP